MLPTFKIDKSAPVLIVEDEAYIATEIEQMLFDFGFTTVDVCLTFSSAAERVAKGGYALAIFDVNVGGMLSFRLISEAISQGSAVITMSGYISSDDAGDGRVFLTKPVSSASLAVAIAKAHHVRLEPALKQGSVRAGKA